MIAKGTVIAAALGKTFVLPLLPTGLMLADVINEQTTVPLTIALPSSSTLVGQIYRVHTKSIVTTLSVTGGSFVDAAVWNTTP